MNKLTLFLLLSVASSSLSGCGFAVGAGAGAVVADEVNEDNHEFDPLEDTRE